LGFEVKRIVRLRGRVDLVIVIVPFVPFRRTWTTRNRLSGGLSHHTWHATARLFGSSLTCSLASGSVVSYHPEVFDSFLPVGAGHSHAIADIVHIGVVVLRSSAFGPGSECIHLGDFSEALLGLVE
jgi:hypothetical protein